MNTSDRERVVLILRTLQELRAPRLFKVNQQWSISANEEGNEQHEMHLKILAEWLSIEKPNLIRDFLIDHGAQLLDKYIIACLMVLRKEEPDVAEQAKLSQRQRLLICARQKEILQAWEEIVGSD